MGLPQAEGARQSAEFQSAVTFEGLPLGWTVGNMCRFSWTENYTFGRTQTAIWTCGELLDSTFSIFRILDSSSSQENQAFVNPLEGELKVHGIQNFSQGCLILGELILGARGRGRRVERGELLPA
ncbi:hypothetical protein MA16_Dca028847 [Dendrobium catenatum]|uniref:Uncharacterized protein n=1 Tax=Dendrobium catenatum TaxID=906689 RepID=A0A2I0VGF4_9ASPA|nr:hypothetical protein MA16_Dca028847 [Dendrobium catenatum]